MFDDIDRWLQESEERFFILTGEPGVGKSAIAARLTQIRDDVAAYHFCIAGRSGTIEPNNVLLSLAAQLIDYFPDYAEALANTIKPLRLSVNVEITIEAIKDSEVRGVVINNLHTQNPQEALNVVLRRSLADLPNPPHQPVLLLIDSLDEAVTLRSDNNLVTLLAEANDLPSWVRFIFTTRPERRVLRYFECLSPYTLAAESQMNLDDIRQYIEKRVGKEKMQARLQLAEVEPQTFVNRLSELSTGNFLYTKILLNDIEAGQQTLDDLSALPQSLDEIYHGFLKRFTVTEWEERYQPILGVLVVAQEAMTEVQLAHFTGIGQGKIRQNLGVVRQFLDISDDGHGCETFTVFHQSLRDYLLNEERNIDFWCEAKEQHQRIVDYYRADDQPWYTRPTSDRYLWHHLAYHLSGASRNSELRALLFNFDWLQAKLNATSIYSLITDFNFLSNEPVLQTLQEALQLSSHILAQNPSQLANQLRGRLMSSEANELQELLRQSIPTGTPWLRFLNSSFTTPGERLIRTLTGHTGNVRAIAITPNGLQIISGSGDNTVKIWNTETGQELYTLKGHTKPIKSVAVSPDDTKIVSASADQTLRVWDLKTRQTRFVLKGHTHEVKAVAITPDSHYALSASEDHTLKLWDLETGQERLTLLGHSDRVEAIAITPDGEKAISGSGDNTVKVWDLKTGQELLTLSGHNAAIRSVAITPNGEQAVSASADRTLIVWNLVTGERVLPPLIGHQEQIQAIAITPDGKQVISASFDRTLKIWDLHTGKELSSWVAHAHQVLAVAITPTGKEIISASFDETIKTWHLDSTKQKKSSTFGHTSKIEYVSVTPNGKEIIACSSKGAIKIWNVQTWSERTIIDLSRKTESAAVTQDGEKAILGLQDGTIQIWNLSLEPQTLNLNEPRQKNRRDRLSLVAVSSDGQIIAAVLSQHTIKIWNREKQASGFGNHKEHFSFQSGQESVSALTIAPDRKQIFAGLSNGTIRSWNLENGKRLDNFQVHQSAITALSTSPDGSLLIAGSSKGALKILDMKVGKERFALDGHTEAVCSIAITSTKVRTASASRDGTLKIWNLTDGKLIESFVGESPLTHCTFSSDNSTLIVGEVSGRLHYLKLEGVD